MLPPAPLPKPPALSYLAYLRYKLPAIWHPSLRFTHGLIIAKRLRMSGEYVGASLVCEVLLRYKSVLGENEIALHIDAVLGSGRAEFIRAGFGGGI